MTPVVREKIENKIGPTENPAAPKPEKRMIQLDFLRGIAILLVIGDHNPAYTLERSLGPLKLPAMLWHRGSWTGVDLFFVLSGFLIGGLLFTELVKRDRLDVKRFMIRRGFKIWPSYYLFVAAVGIWTCAHGHHSLWYSFRAMVPNLLHVQNYWAANAHQTWSLAIEEHFYLALPFLIVLLCRRSRSNRPSGIAVAAGIVMLFCLMFRLAIGWNHPYNVDTMYNPTHVRIDSLFFGVILAYIFHYRRAQFDKAARYRWALLIGGLFLVIPMFLFPLNEKRFVWTFGYTLLYLGYGAILTATISDACTSGHWSRFFRSAPARLIAWIGTFSYSIYLWHIFFTFLLNDLTSANVLASLSPIVRWLFVTGILLAGSIAIGVVLGKLVEIPALALRDRLFPRRASALEQT